MKTAGAIMGTRPMEATGAPTGKKRLVVGAIKCLISGSLIYWLVRGANLREIWDVVRSANNSLLVLGFSLNFVGIYVSVQRWRVLLDAQGISAPFPFLLKSYLVGVFFNNFLPSTFGGDTVRAYDSWRLGKHKEGAVAVILVDRLLGILALLLFAVGALVFQTRLTRDLPSVSLWILLGVAAVLLFLWIILMPSRQISALMTKIRSPIPQKLESIVGTISHAFLAFQGRKDSLVKALGLSLILQANVILHYYLFAEALSLGVPFLDFFLIIPLATFLMMVPVSVNGIGVRENAFVFFFAIFRVSKSAAIAFAWLAYGVVLFQGLLGGIVYALRK